MMMVIVHDSYDGTQQWWWAEIFHDSDDYYALRYANDDSGGTCNGDRDKLI